MRPLNKQLYLADGTTTNAVGNYSVTKNTAGALCPAGKTWLVKGITFVLSDAAMEVGKYGALTALSNGIKVGIKNPPDSLTATVTPATLLVPVALTNIADLMLYGDGAEFLEPGAGDDILRGEFKFDPPVTVTGLQSIGVYLQDNLTGLSIHEFSLYGTELESNGYDSIAAGSTALTVTGDITSGEEFTGAVELNLYVSSGTVSEVRLLIGESVQVLAETADHTYGEDPVAITVHGENSTSYVESRLTPTAEVLFASGAVKRWLLTDPVTVVAQSVTWTGVTPATATATVQETFVLNYTEDGDSLIDSVTFSWGDGTADVIDSTPPYQQNHTYAVAGPYTITVTMTFSDGSTQVETEAITVS